MSISQAIVSFTINFLGLPYGACDDIPLTSCGRLLGIGISLTSVGISGCYYGEAAHFYYFTAVPGLVCELVFFSLMIYKSWSTYRWCPGSPLLTILVRDRCVSVSAKVHIGLTQS